MAHLEQVLGYRATSWTPATITTSASANTKGSWANLTTTANNLNITGYTVMLWTAATSGCDYLIDIGNPSVPWGTTLASNLILSCPTDASKNVVASYYFPVSVPNAAYSFQARAQASTAGAKNVVVAVLLNNAMSHQSPHTTIETIGATTADSGGTSVDPGAVAGVAGSWVQLSAGLTNTWAGFLIGIGGQGNVARATATWTLDVAHGTSQQHSDVSGFPVTNYGSTGLITPSGSPPIWAYIPAGEEVYVRAKCDITDPTDRLLDVVLYGIVM